MRELEILKAESAILKLALKRKALDLEPRADDPLELMH
jgi:hypothetical protein